MARCSVLDGYCSTVQGLLDWFEVDLGFPELFLRLRVRSEQEKAREKARESDRHRDRRRERERERKCVCVRERE